MHAEHTSTAPTVLQSTAPNVLQNTAPTVLQSTAPNVLQSTAPTVLQPNLNCLQSHSTSGRGLNQKYFAPNPENSVQLVSLYSCVILWRDM